MRESSSRCRCRNGVQPARRIDKSRTTLILVQVRACVKSSYLQKRVRLAGQVRAAKLALLT